MSIKAFNKRVLPEEIVYPDSDGKRMADNTLQAMWIFMLYDNFRGLFSGQEIFVAADLLWYPVEGRPDICVAPDVLIVFGRPDGYRGSYKQWIEDNVAPQVVFEVLSPSNTHKEILIKTKFYERHGVEELIIIDPIKNSFVAYVNKEGKLTLDNEDETSWKSPMLEVSFGVVEREMKVFHADGAPFQTFEELKAESDKILLEKKKAEAEVERLKARLKELGEDI